MSTPRPSSDAVAGWLLDVDGTSCPNPGPIAVGLVLRSPAGECHTRSIRLPLAGCNNEAEWRALIAGLELAQQLGVQALTVRSDSSVLVGQMRGEAQTGVARLLELAAHSHRLLAGFSQVDFSWVPRHRNREADALARAALGLSPKIAKPRKKRRR